MVMAVLALALIPAASAEAKAATDRKAVTNSGTTGSSDSRVIYGLNDWNNGEQI